MLFSELFYYAGRVIRWKFGDKTPLIASIKLTTDVISNVCIVHGKDLEKKPELSLNDWKLKLKITSCVRSPICFF